MYASWLYTQYYINCTCKFYVMFISILVYKYVNPLNTSSYVLYDLALFFIILSLYMHKILLYLMHEHISLRYYMYVNGIGINI